MRSVLGNRLTIGWLLLPSIILYTVSVIAPIIWSGYYSLFDWSGFGEQTFIGFGNFAMMIGDAELWGAVGNTLVFTLWQIVLQVGGGLALAVLLSRLPIFQRAFQTMYYLPVIISTVALAQMFKKIFAVTPTGLVNQVLSQFNPAWEHFEWLSSVDRALGMVIATVGYKDIPIYMLIFFAALLTVPREFEEAASIDGASAWQTFWRIKIPHLRPAIAANVVLVLNSSLREYDVPRLLTGGGPLQASETQALYMYKQAFTSMRYGYGSAIAVFIVIQALVFAVVVRRLLREREG